MYRNIIEVLGREEQNEKRMKELLCVCVCCIVIVIVCINWTYVEIACEAHVLIEERTAFLIIEDTGENKSRWKNLLK